MHPPRIVLLAVAAIGLAGGAPAAHAQFANVFVPEPGMLDAMCARFPLLCLAQASQDKTQKKVKSAPQQRLRQRPTSETALLDVLLAALAQRAEH